MALNFDTTGIEKEVKITDMNDDLMIYCYEECHDASPDRVKDCRGIVTDHSGNIVMKTFGYTSEYQCIPTNKNLLNDLLPSIENYQIYDSQEGCLIRVFFYKDKWYISTHKKLDAITSRWSSNETFGEIFEKAVEKYYNSDNELKGKIGGNLEGFDEIFKNLTSLFDKERSYMFLIRNTEANRIVCEASEYEFYYTGSLKLDGSDFDFPDVGIRSPKKNEFKNIDELVDYVNNLDYTKTPGVIVYTPSPVKILNETYSNLFNLRGNEPSIKFRYLQLRTTPQVEEYIKLYPTRVNDFSEYEDILSHIAENVHKCYISRFVKKEFATVPQEQYCIVQQCHEWYKENRTNPFNRVTLAVVKGILNRQNAVTLNRMIKKYKNSQEH